MAHNVIVLTSGLTGSSVLTGLICRAGYWSGDSTHKKVDYDTFENEELVQLNLRILQEAGYSGSYVVEFSRDALQRISALVGKNDSAVYDSFVLRCNDHRPWIWKDPRLWLTMRFWKNFLDLSDCRFILLTRGVVQGWVSATLRRQIRSFGSFRRYEESVQKTITDFFDENDLPYQKIAYEQLIVNPASTIDELNRFLETKLTVEDLKKIYHKPLYKNPGSTWSKQVEAVLIYLKNYSERADRFQSENKP